MLKQFSNKRVTLQKASESDNSDWREVLSSLAGKNVIDDQQQVFLSEIRTLADALKNTVLGDEYEVKGNKLDKETQNFLREVIQKEFNAEKAQMAKTDSNSMVPIQSTELEQKLNALLSGKEQYEGHSEESQAPMATTGKQGFRNETTTKQAGAETKQIEAINQQLKDLKSKQADTSESQAKSDRIEDRRRLVSLEKSIAHMDKVIAENKQETAAENKKAQQLVNKNEKNKAESQYEAQASSPGENKKKIADISTQSFKKSLPKDIPAATNMEELAVTAVNSVKKLKDMVVDKSKVSRILQRQGDIQKYQEEVTAHIAHRVIGESARANVPFNSVKISTNAIEKARQRVSQTIDEVTAAVKNDLDEAQHKATDSVASVTARTLRSPGHSMKQTPGKLSSLSNVVAEASQTATIATMETSAPDQSKTNVTAKKQPGEKKYDADRALSNQLIKEEQTAVATADLTTKLDAAIKQKNTTQIKNKNEIQPYQPDTMEQQFPLVSDFQQVTSAEEKAPPRKTEAIPPIPEELQTAVQWMAEEEVENKLVEILSRQARLRGVDLS